MGGNHSPGLPKYKLGPIMIGLTWLLILGVLFGLYTHVTDMQMVGFLHDDAVYALTAKALALGKGYKLLNLPLPHQPDFTWQVKYPIAYPLLLSLGWLIQPHFPQNIPWLHALTTLCGLIALPLTFYYLRQIKQASTLLAIFICLLISVNFHFIYYTTSLMSEAPYFLWSLLALYCAEKQGSISSKAHLIGAVIFSTLAFHTRTVGLTLIPAIFIALAVRKQWKSAWLYLGISILTTIIPWALWVKWHSMPLNALTYPLAHVYGGYGIEYGITAPKGLLEYLLALISQGFQPIAENLITLMFPQLGYWLVPYPWAFSLLTFGFSALLTTQAIWNACKGRFSASGLYLCFYIVAIALWMYPNQAIRFLVPVLPWLWLYCIRGIADITRINQVQLTQIKKLQVVSWISVGLISLILLSPSWFGYQLLYRVRHYHLLEPTGKTASLWGDYQAAFHFIRNSTLAGARVAGIWDPVFYLYTNHPTFGLFTSSLQAFQGQVTPESFRRLHASLLQYDVQYIVVEPFIVNQQLQNTANPVATILMQLFPKDFKPVYQAPQGLIRIYRLQALQPKNKPR